MSEKRIFEVGYVETTRIAEYYRSITIDVSDYPELERKTDEEIIKYIENNYEKMPSTDDNLNSLYDELFDQDIIRTKDGNVGSYVWVEVYVEEKEGSNDGEDDDE